MTDERDPMLQQLFNAARQELPGRDFLTRVMSDVDRQRRKTMIGWSLAGLLLLPVAWLLSSPVNDAVSLMTQLLPTSLVEVENELLAQLFAPVNSVAVPLALGILGIRMAYRKIFR